MFGNLNSGNDIKEQGDVLGGGVSESDLYDAEIKVAYAIEANSKAKGVVLELKLEGGGTMKETVYVTSGEAKGCKNYYEKDGEKHFLPGFSLINAICMLTVEKELQAMAIEQKTLKIYDYDAKAEVPKEVPVLVELTGKKIKVGALKVRRNKTKNENGTRVTTNEEQFINELDRVFHYPSGVTIAEARAKQPAEFINKWLAKWKGQVKDTFQAVQGGGTAGRPSGAQGGGSEKPSSLFG